MGGTAIDGDGVGGGGVMVGVGELVEGTFVGIVVELEFAPGVSSGIFVD